MKKIKSVIDKPSLSRIWRLVTKHDSGTISAFRSINDCGDPINKFDNQVRNGQLKSMLLTMGYGLAKFDGVHIENYSSSNARKIKCESFIVIDIKDVGKLKHDLIKLGTYFDQDSITFSKPNGEYYLISTNACPDGYPGIGFVGKSIKLREPFFGRSGKSGGLYSTVIGRPFVIESINPNYSILTDYFPTEIRSFVMNASEISPTPTQRSGTPNTNPKQTG